MEGLRLDSYFIIIIGLIIGVISQETQLETRPRSSRRYGIEYPSMPCIEEFEKRPGKNFKSYERCLKKNGTLQPVPFRCPCVHYFDYKMKDCLTIPGGGEVVYADYNGVCKDNYKGVLVHPTQKQFYYVCKDDGVLVVKCPKLQIFDRQKNYCVIVEDPSTITVYDESNGDVELPSCEGPGRYPIPGQPIYFYMCTLDGDKYYRSVFKCQSGSVYDPKYQSCVQMLEITTVTTTLGWYLDSDPYPPCLAPGRYRSHKDCSLYYVCSAKVDGTFYQTRMSCPNGMLFCLETMKCRLALEVKCDVLGYNQTDITTKHKTTTEPITTEMFTEDYKLTTMTEWEENQETTKADDGDELLRETDGTTITTESNAEEVETSTPISAIDVEFTSEEGSQELVEITEDSISSVNEGESSTEFYEVSTASNFVIENTTKRDNDILEYTEGIANESTTIGEGNNVDNFFEVSTPVFVDDEEKSTLTDEFTTEMDKTTESDVVSEGLEINNVNYTSLPPPIDTEEKMTTENIETTTEEGISTAVDLDVSDKITVKSVNEEEMSTSPMKDEELRTTTETVAESDDLESSTYAVTESETQYNNTLSDMEKTTPFEELFVSTNEEGIVESTDVTVEGVTKGIDRNIETDKDVYNEISDDEEVSTLSSTELSDEEIVISTNDYIGIRTTPVEGLNQITGMDDLETTTEINDGTTTITIESGEISTVNSIMDEEDVTKGIDDTVSKENEIGDELDEDIMSTEVISDQSTTVTEPTIDLHKNYTTPDDSDEMVTDISTTDDYLEDAITESYDKDIVSLTTQSSLEDNETDTESTTDANMTTMNSENETETTELVTEDIETTTYIDQCTMDPDLAAEYDLKCTEAGAFSINNSCYMYYECTWNDDGELVPEVLECPKCLRFNEKVGYCDLPQNVPRCYELYSNPDIRCDSAGNFSIKGVCDQYKECILEDGGTFRKVIHTCPEGLNFNNVTKECDSKTQCPFRIEPKCLAVGMFQDAERCNEFYECSKANSSLEFSFKRYRCPPSLVFNEKKGTCDFPRNVPGCENVFH